MASSIRRAFTLMELLIVIGIIAVLVGITFMVGRASMGGSKKSVTLDSIRVLDAALTAYNDATGENPPAWVQDPRPNAAERVIPVADARDVDAPNANTAGAGADAAIIDSVALFFLQCQSVPEAKSILDRLPTKLAVQRAVRVGSQNPQTVQLTTVLDGWGKPIRYVHPAFSASFQASSTSAILAAPKSLATGNPKTWTITNISRTYTVAPIPSPTTAPPVAFPDSDGGRCPGGRAYFYSAGEDGMVGREANNGATTKDYDKDNLYSVPPISPKF